MKLSTKIMISSLAVLLISTPAFNTLLNSTPADQVVHASSSTVIKLSSTGKVPIFNSKGNQLNGQFLKGGEVITSYGKPVIIRHKYQRSGIFPTVKIDGKSYTSLGDGGYILVNHTGGYTAKGMRIVSNATVYNEISILRLIIFEQLILILTTMRVIIHFGLDSLWNKLALLIALRDAYVSY